MPPELDDPCERFAALGQIAAEMAHELSNALQTLSNAAFVARQVATAGDARTTLVHLATIERNAHGAHAIVEGMMTLARGEPLKRERVAFRDLVAAARADLPCDGALWHDGFEPADLRILAHPALFARLLSALYANSIQASAPRAPHVTTTALATGGRVVVDVADDGPGVPAPIAPRVFEPLVTGRAGGTGLGLSLARRLARAHGGSLALVDAPPGTGACFRLELPVDDDE